MSITKTKYMFSTHVKHGIINEVKKNSVISVVCTAEIFKTMHSSLIEQIHIAVAQAPSSQHQHSCISLQVTISHQCQQPTEWSSSSTNNKTCNAVSVILEIHK